MTFIVDVTKVSTEDNGKWKTAVVSYIRDGKPATQKVVSFKEQADAFLSLTANQAGRYEISVQKNGNFYNWVKAVPVSSSVSQATAQNTPQHNTSSGGTGSRSFETAEERAERQVLIVRQSALDRAVGTLSVGAKTPPKREDVTDLAQYYADWVFGKVAREVQSGIPGVDFEEDISF